MCAKSELVLNDRGRGRHRQVGRNRGQDEQVDVGRRKACIGESGAGGVSGEIGGELSFSCNPALLDAGAGQNPLVGGVDLF